MEQRFYLKKVKAYVSREEYRPRLKPLEQELNGNGIGFEFADGGLGMEGTFVPEADMFCPGGRTGRLQEQAAASCSCVMAGELWLTDSASFARGLAKAGLPFAVWIHPGSRDQDFSMARYGLENPEETEVCFLDRVYRRFCGLPWDILETERCLVRETTEEDVDAFFGIYSDPAVTRYTEGLYPEPDQEKEYVREYREKIYAFYGFGVWTVLLRETGEVIGRAGFSYRPGYEDPELGFVTGVPWQGRGLTREVCGAILAYGREELGFTRVQALSEPENKASLALLERLGFTPRGTVRECGKEFMLLVREEV